MEILIVEDHPKMRQLMARILDHIGFRTVFLSDNVEDAVAVLDRQNIGLIFCDYHLKNTTCLALHEKIAARPEFSDIPFVIVTADTNSNILIEGARRGLHMLYKPFQPAHVQRLVSKLVGPEAFANSTTS